MAGNKLFGVDIAKIVHQNMSKGLLPATLTKIVLGDRTAGDLTAGKAQTPTDYTCKGFVEDYTDKQMDGSIIQSGDRKIILIGDSIQSGVVPDVNDTITIEDRAYKIVGPIKRDPAKATYTCQGR